MLVTYKIRRWNEKVRIIFNIKYLNFYSFYFVLMPTRRLVVDCLALNPELLWIYSGFFSSVFFLIVLSQIYLKRTRKQANVTISQMNLYAPLLPSPKAAFTYDQQVALKPGSSKASFLLLLVLCSYMFTDHLQTSLRKIDSDSFGWKPLNFSQCKVLWYVCNPFLLKFYICALKCEKLLANITKCITKISFSVFHTRVSKAFKVYSNMDKCWWI